MFSFFFVVESKEQGSNEKKKNKKPCEIHAKFYKISPKKYDEERIRQRFDREFDRKI